MTGEHLEHENPDEAATVDGSAEVADCDGHDTDEEEEATDQQPISSSLVLTNVVTHAEAVLDPAGIGGSGTSAMARARWCGLAVGGFNVTAGHVVRRCSRGTLISLGRVSRSPDPVSARNVFPKGGENANKRRQIRL